MFMQVSLRNRIAALYVLATGIIAAIVFLLLYYVVQQTMYNHLDTDLQTESKEVFKGIVVLRDQFIFANPYEWKEGEHRQVEVNPTFLQVIDTTGNILRKSENLFQSELNRLAADTSTEYYNTSLSGSSIRQTQIPIMSTENAVLGYVLIAVPLSEVEILLGNLQLLLIVVYPVVLFALFLTSRFIAGKSIAPVERVISTAEKITKENLDQRIELPVHHDEMFRLTTTINQLLERLQDAVFREKQFTSDASHELRTPLTSMKGTLEVLLRRPRTAKFYKKKISFVIDEINRMSRLVDQLLAFARFESNDYAKNITPIELPSFVRATLQKMENELTTSKSKVTLKGEKPYIVRADKDMLSIMIQNIVSNAIKYAKARPDISISFLTSDAELLCIISDKGKGISKEQLPFIFDRFYRTDESRTSEISGNGLGLALVRRYAETQGLFVTVGSELHKGSSFTIHFPSFSF